MDIYGKKTMEFNIEYEICKDTNILKINKKQTKTYKRYVNKFAKLIKKMVKAGFRFKDQEEQDQNKEV